jgi:predicted aldo/keto reductase-like oxidoreductase
VQSSDWQICDEVSSMKQRKAPMLLRSVPKTKWKVSPLAFGCMRFKDEVTAIEAIHKAVELGVNYFDVAPAYGGGSAEVKLGLAVKGIRDKCIITAKSSPGSGGPELGTYQPEKGFGIRTADQVRREIERSMHVMGVDHLDMYQLWAVHAPEIFHEAIKPGGFMEGVLKAKEEGLCDYIGLTTHGDDDEIISYIKDSPYEFDMVTLSFSFRNTDRTRAIEYCASRGIGVIAMNPLGGGSIVKPSPAQLRIAREAGFETLAGPALRFVAFYPGVTAALNGITYAQHAVEGVAAIEEGPLPKETEGILLAKIQELHANVKHFCTACGYCGECPMGIAIPELLELYSGLLVPSLSADAKEAYIGKVTAGARGLDPAVCTACKQCEQKCPNRLPVSRLMGAARAIWPTA